MEKFLEYIKQLSDPCGGFQPSPVRTWLGIADGKVSDVAAASYAAEICTMLGGTLPFREQTIAYLKRCQNPEGWFSNAAPLPGITSDSYKLYNTCAALRGLRSLGAEPDVDPRPWMQKNCLESTYIGPYDGDFYANSFAVLDSQMPEECFEKLSAYLLDKQECATGWLIQPGLAELGLPMERNNPFTFHAARMFYLQGKVIPMAEKIVDTFLRMQEFDGSWTLGGVHGTFDAVVTLRMLEGATPRVNAAISRAAEWSLKCRRNDNGFNHFGDRIVADELNGHGKIKVGGAIDNAPSEMDASYFQAATLVMAGIWKNENAPQTRWAGWGHTLLKGVVK